MVVYNASTAPHKCNFCNQVSFSFGTYNYESLLYRCKLQRTDRDSIHPLHYTTHMFFSLLKTALALYLEYRLMDRNLLKFAEPSPWACLIMYYSIILSINN